MNEKDKKCIHNSKVNQEQLQQLKIENEELKRELNNIEKDRKWIKEKCIEAGKELGKYSFAWDGKEKNLVIQAMELNTMYEQLKAENDKLKERIVNGVWVDKINVVYLDGDKMEEVNMITGIDILHEVNFVDKSEFEDKEELRRYVDKVVLNSIMNKDIDYVVFRLDI